MLNSAFSQRSAGCWACAAHPLWQWQWQCLHPTGIIRRSSHDRDGLSAESVPPEADRVPGPQPGHPPLSGPIRLTTPSSLIPSPREALTPTCPPVRSLALTITYSIRLPLLLFWAPSAERRAVSRVFIRSHDGVCHQRRQCAPCSVPVPPPPPFDCCNCYCNRMLCHHHHHRERSDRLLKSPLAGLCILRTAPRFISPSLYLCLCAPTTRIMLFPSTRLLAWAVPADTSAMGGNTAPQPTSPRACVPPQACGSAPPQQDHPAADAAQTTPAVSKA